MGRADIAILSEISFRIRLCLHPPALSMEGLAYDDGSLSRPLDFCRDTSDVPRRETAPSHLITHIFCALSRYGVIWEDRFLPVMDIPQPRNHRPALWQDGKGLVAPV
jgi:hypothetical protein